MPIIAVLPLLMVKRIADGSSVRRAVDPLTNYRHGVQAYVQWHRTWRKTHEPNHLRVALICLAIARERHAIAAFAGETLNQAFRKQARRGGRKSGG